MSAATGHANSLGIVSTLTSLQRLRVYWPPSYCKLQMPSRRKPGPKLVLTLPHLVDLYLEHLEEGELVLACPRLARAELKYGRSLRLNVEDAAMEYLRVKDCYSVQLTMRFPAHQLGKLKELHVSGCTEIGRHLIEDVALMKCLRKLTYEDFPARRMPCSFPRSLQDIELLPVGWCRDYTRTGGPKELRDLPEGLKELGELKRFYFYKPFNMTRPPAELLPVDSLEVVSLYYDTYYPQSNKEALDRLWKNKPSRLSTWQVW